MPIEIESGSAVDFDQMVGAQKTLHARLRQDRAQELRGDVAFQRPVAVLENTEWSHAASWTPRPINQRNKQVELQSLHQLPLRTDRIERLQQIARSSFSGGIDSRPIGE